MNAIRSPLGRSAEILTRALSAKARIGEPQIGLTAIALTGIAVFPLLGNALALATGQPRRFVQAGLLVLFCGVLVVAGRHVYAWSGVRWTNISRALRCAWIGSIGLILLRIGLSLGAGQRPALYAVVAVVLSVAWLTLVVYQLADRVSTQKFRAETSIHPEFQGAMVFMLGFVALLAYFMGPDPGNAYMAFRGSTTQSGTSAAIFAGIAMRCLQKWYRAVGLLLALYLNFIATSRTGILLVVLLTAVVVVTRSANEKLILPRVRFLIRELVFVAICAVIVVVPVFTSRHYPYASTLPAPVGAHIQYKNLWLTDLEGLIMRYSRILRLTRNPASLEDLTFEEIYELEREGVADSRWLIIKASVQAIAAQPFGHWPRPFERVTNIYCGNPPICPYPHNIVLEIGYYFGWLPAGIMILGLAVLAARAARMVSHPDLLVQILSIALLGYLGFAQFSGNLLDQTIALAFGTSLTMARRSAPA